MKFIKRTTCIMVLISMSTGPIHANSFSKILSLSQKLVRETSLCPKKIKLAGIGLCSLGAGLFLTILRTLSKHIRIIKHLGPYSNPKAHTLVAHHDKQTNHGIILEIDRIVPQYTLATLGVVTSLVGAYKLLPYPDIKTEDDEKKQTQGRSICF